MSEKEIKKGAKLSPQKMGELLEKGTIKTPEIPEEQEPCGNGKKPKLPNAQKPPRKTPLDPRLGKSQKRSK